MTLGNLPWLLAQSSPVMHLGDRFRPGQARGDSAAVWLIALAAAGGLTLVWLAAQVLRRRQQRLRHSPWRLFRDLCAAHRLTYRQRHLLRRVAQAQQLPQPAILFLNPQSWDLGPASPLDPRTRQELESLQRQLFAPR
jgi:protein involved in polysaccharide export with SLBB domain